MAQSPYAQIIQALFQDGVEPADLDQLRGMLDNVEAGTVGTNLTGVATDPTYRSGFDYARSIAGGMPFEQVVAPGMSFSPDRPMGYTQADLTTPFYSPGLAPVKPVAPTKDEPLAMEDQMPYAPPGTKEPTIFGQQPSPEVANLFEGIDKEALSEKIAELNLFNFEDLDLTNLPGVSEVEPQASLFDVALSMPPSPAATPSPIPQITPTQTLTNIGYDEADIEEILERQQTRPSRFFEPAPVMPTAPIPTPVIPTNLTGLPQMPYIPPVVTPSVLREPMINIDEIVSPISAGRTVQRMPNLFNIV